MYSGGMSCLLLAILVILMALIAQYVNREIPEPYMVSRSDLTIITSLSLLPPLSLSLSLG